VYLEQSRNLEVKLNVMEKYIYIGIVAFQIIFKVIWDWRAKNVEGRIISHPFSWFMNFIVSTISAHYIFNDVLGQSHLYVLGVLLITSSIFWIVFDIIFNELNDWVWNHYGKSAYTDKLLTKAGKFHLLVKSIPAIIGIALIHYF